MADIVDRLRQWSEFGYGVEATATMKEAAAEIERLRAALKGCIAMLEQLGYTPISKSARAALEGKHGKCHPVQFSDQIVCGKCDLTWDVNDPEPPRCKESRT